MKFLEKIHIVGFRRLCDLNIILKPLNVVIGANGSGKTSLVGCAIASCGFRIGQAERRDG